MSNQVNGNGALSGYQVLDLTAEWGMPSSRLLASMGAEVIRIDKPEEAKSGKGQHWELNLGKRSITLDIEHPTGQQVFQQLAATSDAIVESYHPGYLSSLGIGYPELWQVNPRLIMASITAYGQNGPYHHYRSSNLAAAALGGWLQVCGEPHQPPLMPYGNQADFTASLFAAIGILAVIWQRCDSSQGQHIDIAVMECVTATLDHVLVRYFYQGEVAQRQGSLHGNNALRVFPCRDGHILLTLHHQWDTLVEWLDAEGMAADLTDRKWQHRDQRLRQLDHIIDVLTRWTSRHTVAELVDQGQLMHFPWAAVNSIPQVVASPQLAERNFWVSVDHPETGEKCQFPGVPCRLSQSPWQMGHRAPYPGEDNQAVYRDRLGLSPETIESLRKEGVI